MEKQFYYYYKLKNSNTVIRVDTAIENDNYVQVSEKEYEQYVAKRKQKLEYRKELMQLNKWFADYDKQTVQYARCQRLGVPYDKDIAELDRQAVGNAKRIKELQALLNS